jgi:hypothetical protein
LQGGYHTRSEVFRTIHGASVGIKIPPGQDCLVVDFHAGTGAPPNFRCMVRALLDGGEIPPGIYLARGGPASDARSLRWIQRVGSSTTETVVRVEIQARVQKDGVTPKPAGQCDIAGWVLNIVTKD